MPTGRSRILNGSEGSERCQASMASSSGISCLISASAPLTRDASGDMPGGQAVGAFSSEPSNDPPKSLAGEMPAGLRILL